MYITKYCVYDYVKSVFCTDENNIVPKCVITEVIFFLW